MSKLVVVGGGRGFIGRTLQAALQRRGHETVLVSRHAGAGRLTWQDIEKSGLPSDTKAVINLAGRNILEPGSRWTELFEAEVWNSRINTTKLLRDAIVGAEKRPDVFVSTSAVGFYQPNNAREYTEESEGGKGDYLAELCAAWEDAAQIPEDVAVRHAIIRIGKYNICVVLGRDGGVIQNMYWPFFFGVGGHVGSGGQPFPWIHVADVARLFVYAVENPQVKGVLNGVAPNLISNSQFATALGQAMKRPAILPVPSFAVNLMFGPERAKIMLEGQKVLPKRTLEAGFSFKYPNVEDACKQCINIMLAVAAEISQEAQKDKILDCEDLPPIEIPPNHHRLQHTYCLWFSRKKQGKNTSTQNFDQNLKRVYRFATVEQFWEGYSYLKRPSELTTNSDFHMFKDGIKPLWEDDANRNGGKWIVRLRKGLSSRFWEILCMAMLGEQFMVGEEICGVVVSVRYGEDIIALWNRTASDQATTARIQNTIKRILNLPPQTVLEYKTHNDSLRDSSGFRHAETFRQGGVAAMSSCVVCGRTCDEKLKKRIIEVLHFEQCSIKQFLELNHVNHRIDVPEFNFICHSCDDLVSVCDLYKQKFHTHLCQLRQRSIYETPVENVGMLNAPASWRDEFSKDDPLRIHDEALVRGLQNCEVIVKTEVLEETDNASEEDRISSHARDRPLGEVAENSTMPPLLLVLKQKTASETTSSNRTRSSHVNASLDSLTATDGVDVEGCGSITDARQYKIIAPQDSGASPDKENSRRKRKSSSSANETFASTEDDLLSSGRRSALYPRKRTPRSVASEETEAEVGVSSRSASKKRKVESLGKKTLPALLKFEQALKVESQNAQGFEDSMNVASGDKVTGSRKRKASKTLKKSVPESDALESIPVEDSKDLIQVDVGHDFVEDFGADVDESPSETSDPSEAEEEEEEPAPIKKKRGRKPGTPNKKPLKSEQLDSSEPKVPKSKYIARPWINCTVCDYKTRSPKIYAVHIRVKHRLGPFLKCDQCDQEFQHNEQLQVHVSKIHLKQPRFSCEECGKAYFGYRAFLNHKTLKHPKSNETQICEICGDTILASGVARERHIRKHNPSKRPARTCHICGNVYYYVLGLQNHLFKAHGIGEGIPKHSRVRKRCELCGRSWSTCDFYRQHMYTVHNIEVPGLKRFQCAFCPKVFHVKMLLESHTHSHTGVKKYDCARCGYATKYYCNWAKHLRKVHGDDPKQYYKDRPHAQNPASQNPPPQPALPAPPPPPPPPAD
ncbi:unnamed protein product [Notodromas monacha]|uniref:eIF-4F 25 kDa subunit n=1 Tax=Notodromas monacha TaxID=399045 RepID=A0A7R9G9D6_9CRUS|nr:unnamed protein product [Notodromas monacha]CAG0914151.1 unnamed protein product [Notodromas monacha]